MRNVKVIIWGFGAMGSGMARMLLNKQGVEIIGICDRNPQIVGKSLNSALGIQDAGQSACVIKDNIDDIIKPGCCDVVLVTTDSHLKKAYSKLEYCLNQGLNVICTAEELAYPMAQSPELAEELNKIARKNKVTLLGTGINPGFVMDYLVLALTGTCENVQSIKVSRVNDLSPFGKTVMDEQGVGISLNEYHERVAAGNLAGHVGFAESVRMIADGLGIEMDSFRQSMDPIVSNTVRETEYTLVEPGKLAGVKMSGVGFYKGEVFVELDHPQQVKPQIENVDTGDSIIIQGTPNINMAIKPEISGGIGTIAICVNMIPHVINANPGLKTMIDLPIPRAILGDMRKLIQTECLGN